MKRKVIQKLVALVSAGTMEPTLNTLGTSARELSAQAPRCAEQMQAQQQMGTAFRSG